MQASTLHSFLPQPRLNWIQVGITTHCNGSCIYCPRTQYQGQWQSRHMDLELFSRFVSNLKKVELIYLQGWGEPFLHPDFWQMLELVKKKGFLAGCTSNANLLDTENLTRLVDQGLDVLALSLAGADAQTNDRIRQGTSFRQVTKTIEELQRIKARQGADKPSLHLAYMLLRQGLEDLDQLPGLFLDLGLDHVVISSLSLPLSKELERQAWLADSPQEYRELKAKMAEIFSSRQLADKVFVNLYNPFHKAGECAENVQKALCLSPEGRVSPCVFTQIPVQGTAAYWHQGREYILQQVDFGDVQVQDLKSIWYSKEYRQFRRKQDLEMCLRCAKNRIDNRL
ncbi:MAG: radical SAM/SPASM domain-containing protein [Thermodesulfobacteriota bacterium]